MHRLGWTRKRVRVGTGRAYVYTPPESQLSLPKRGVVLEFDATQNPVPTVPTQRRRS